MASALVAPIRNRLRRVPLLRRLRDRMLAGSLASEGKRLDLVAAQVAQLLSLSGVRSVEGAVCLELGSGWVLTHAVVLHLLGARRVIATDIEHLAKPAALRAAVRRSHEAAVRDLLSPFTEPTAVRARLAALQRVDLLDDAALAQLGIEYRAPVDIAAAPLGEAIDFACSFSCLEHVPLDQIRPLLTNLAADLRPGGAMLHAIHLEDHQDFAADPFAFLGEATASFGRDEQSSRGNRLRASEWLRAFREVPGLSAEFVYAWQRLDRPLPPVVVPEVAHADEQDLRTSHIAILARKALP